MEKEITFAEKARIVAEQSDKWNIPLVLLSNMYQNPYVMIEELYKSISKYEVKDGESHNQWFARVTSEQYPHYIQKMGDSHNNRHRETMAEREERFERYKKHKAEFYKK